MSKPLAYLDAGSATMMLQVIGGAIAAAAVAVKLFWRRILRALGWRRNTGGAGPGHDVSEEQRPVSRSDS